MKCAYCQETLQKNDKFCASCGKKVTNKISMKHDENTVRKSKRKIPFSVLFLSVLFITAVLVWGVIAYINKPYYVSGFEAGNTYYDDEEDTTLLMSTFGEDHESERSNYKKEQSDDNDYEEVELSLVESMSNVSSGRYSSFNFEKGIIVENTGDVPIYLDDFEFSFKDRDGDKVTLEELEEANDDFYFLIYNDLPNRAIYPGERYTILVDEYIDGSAIRESGYEFGLVDQDLRETIKAMFTVSYYVKDKDIENVKKGKVLKDNPHPQFEMENVKLQESGDEILISGMLTTESKQDYGDLLISIEFYDESENLQYVQKVTTAYYGDSIDLSEDLELEEIPNRIIFDTFAEDYIVNINVTAY